MISHPTRKELILAARGDAVIDNAHIAGCDWCSLYFELFSKFPLAGELPLVSAPKPWIEKAMAVAEIPAKSTVLKSLVARLSFDSWSMPAPEGVRGAGVFEERRICFEVSGKIFDLRAEHRQNRWDFTAKITDKLGIPADWVVTVGNEEHFPDTDGFYQWSSVRPPKKIRLLSDDGEIETPELSWKKSRQE